MENSQERLRIARDLHDGIAQELAALGYTLDALIGRTVLDQASRDALRQVRAEITELTHRTRDEIFALRLPRAITADQELTQRLQSIFHQTNFTFEIVGLLAELATLSEEALREIIKVISELARNTRAHSLGDRFSLLINQGQLHISDNGPGGIDLQSHRFGLTGITERLAAINYLLAYEPDTNTITLTQVSS